MAFLSLFGLPPLAGFVGKLEVFTAAIDAGQTWLAVVAVINTLVSLFYYLRVIAPTVLDPGWDASATRGAQSPDRPLAVALGVATAATVLVGVVAEPLLRVATDALMLTS